MNWWLRILDWDTRKTLAVLSLLWVGMQVACFLYFGIKQPFDTAFYIQSAELLADGELPQDRGVFYIAYIGVLSLIHLLGVPYSWVVMVHLIASCTAMFCLFQLGQTLGGRKTAILVSLLYVFWFELHQWNFILYTDSLFTSCGIVSFFGVYRSKRIKHLVMLLPFLVFTCFLRSSGPPLALGLMAFLVYRYTSDRNTLGIVLRKSFFLFLPIFIFISLQMAFPRDFGRFVLSNFCLGEIICPYPAWSFRPPPGCLDTSGDLNFSTFLSYVAKYPIFSTKVFLSRGLFFFLHLKPFFHWGHNLLILVVVLPHYFFLLIKPMRKMLAPSISAFFWTYGTLLAFGAIFMGENWDGRFLLPLLPFLFLFGSTCLMKYYQQKYAP